MIRARLLWLCLSLLGLLWLASCARVSQPATARQKATLTFAFWALSPTETALMQRLARQFEATHPDLQLALLEIPQRYYEKLQTLFAAGTPPDVMSLNYGRAGDFARRGVLRDLSPFVAQDQLFTAQFLPIAVEHFRTIGRCVGRPGVYAWPQDWNPTNLLLYDPEVFAEVGVRPPQASWTWDDFAQACRRLTRPARDPSQRRYGAAVCLYPYATIAWLWQAGGTVLGPRGDESRLATPANICALSFLASLAHEGLIARPVPGEDRSLEDFLAGRAAMAFVTPYALAKLRGPDNKRRWALGLPLRNVRQATGCIPTGLAISAACAHPSAAWKFVRYLATEGAAARAQAALAVPAWRPALEGPAFLQGFGPQAAPILKEAAAFARPYPLSRVLPYEQLSGALRDALERIFGGGEDAARALREADATLNQAARRASASPIDSSATAK